MNTPFTHPIAQSSSRNWFTGAKALFVAAVTCFGFAGTANAQSTLRANVTAGTADAVAPNNTVTSFVTAQGINNVGSYAAGQSVSITGTTAFVSKLAPVSSAYTGASGSNYFQLASTSNPSSFTISNIDVDNSPNIVVSFGIYVPTAAALAQLQVQYGFGTGGGGNANISTPLTFAPQVTVGQWCKVTVFLNTLPGTQANMGLRFTKTGTSEIRIDDINVSQFTSVCDAVAVPGYSKVWVGAGAPSIVNTNTLTNKDFTNSSNWCPSTALTSTDKLYIKTISGGTINLTTSRTVSGLAIENIGATPLAIEVGDAGSLTIGTDGLLVPTTSTGEISFQNTAGSLAAINIAGNLSNLATTSTAKLNLNDARVIFNKTGAGAQNISSTSELTMGALTIDSDAGDIDVTLATNVKVEGAITMAKGVLFTNTNKVIYGTSATISESATSYLRGNLEVLPRQISPTVQNFGGLGLRLSVPAGSYTTSINRITGTPVEAQVAMVPGGSLQTNYSIARIFEIHVQNAPADINATMEFDFWNHELGMLTASTLRFFRQTDNGSWSNKGYDNYNAPTSTTAGTLTLNDVEQFSTWTLGSNINPLPVELISFSAKRDGDASLLEWSTAKEENNAGYEIEASTDNRNFTKIGYVHAMQTAYQGAEYNFVEPKAARFGLRYYRLTQYDLDGTKTVLGVRTVNFGSTGASVITGPNPFTYGFAALVEAEVAQPATLILTDALGREVARQQTQLVRGVNQVDFDAANLSSGSSILSVQLATDVLTIKVNKQ